MVNEDLLKRCPANVVAEVKALFIEIKALKGKLRYASRRATKGDLEKLESISERDWMTYETLEGRYKI